MAETAILEREHAHLFTYGSTVGVLPGISNDGEGSAVVKDADVLFSSLPSFTAFFSFFVACVAMDFDPTFEVGKGSDNIGSHAIADARMLLQIIYRAGIVAILLLSGPTGQKKFLLLCEFLKQKFVLLWDFLKQEFPWLQGSDLVIAVEQPFVSHNTLLVIPGALKLLAWVLAFHALALGFNNSVGLRGVGDSTQFNYFGQSHGRMLLDINHDIQEHGSFVKNDIFSVDLRKIIGNGDSFEQQKNWSSHNSSEIPAVLYVLMNGKQVKINCNLIADQKALAQWISTEKSDQLGKNHGNMTHWISIESSDQLGKVHGETTEMQNRTDKSHLPEHKTLKSVVVVAVIALAISILSCGGLLLWWCMCWKRGQRNELVQDETISQLELFGGIGPREFKHHELSAATDNFANENMLGHGGFGPVYKGYLRDQERAVAVKVLSKESRQGPTEFEAEVKVMTQLKHRNIVQLLGWCNSNKQLLLVYELMAGGSLDKYLHGRRILTWQQRYNIILGLGSALHYLHQDCNKYIVHGDIKPANVLLDASLNAKLGDFGTARPIDHGTVPQTTQNIAGTHGYMDPAFMNNGLRDTAQDVYSFGIILLEIASAKPAALSLPNGAWALLVNWVHDLYHRSRILDAADRKLDGEFDQQQMERVLVTGLWCAQDDPSKRPSIAQAMDVLRSADAKLPVLPARYDSQHIRSLEQQASGDQPVEDLYEDAVSATTYITSKDSIHLLAEE